MNKKISLIIAIFVLSFTIQIKDSNAALFNWKTEYIPEVSKISRDWSFGFIFNKSEAGLKDKEASEESLSPVRIQKTYVVQASAYSSTVDQTDDSPFITASGSTVRDGIVAANFLPFGTTIRIPDVYGDKIFVVEDRMNKRYQNNIDIWFPERELAKQFGRRNVRIEVVSELKES